MASGHRTAGPAGGPGHLLVILGLPGSWEVPGLTIPALSAFTFAIFTGPVLNAAGVADALVASCACPALFTAAGSPDADAVSATVY